VTDWPTIQCQPGPTDAELAAERDAKHVVEVADWIEQNWRGLNGARQAMEEVVSMLITQKDAARKKIDAATQGTPERSIALGEWLALVTATERVCAIFAGRPTC